MKLQVAAILFSHNSEGSSATALRLRRNAFETFLLPEWQRGLTRDADDCSIAYAIQKVLSKPISIKVKFNVIGLDGAEPIQIRAREPELNSGQFFLDILFNTHVNILGRVSEKNVVVTNGETDFISFELENHRIGQWGVGIFDVIWKWQFRAQDSLVWEDIEITKHKVYILIDEPTQPWSQASPLLLPWAQLLNFACSWAARTISKDDAASAITRTLYNLGPELFEYNCLNFLPSYVQVIGFNGATFFNCTSFLQHLQSGNINRFIICTDCATIVSTFANALGCDLWQSKMETPGTIFRVNPIIAIGGLTWQLPCGFPGFSYHEVAWKGNCTSADAIFDACLAIDGNNSPFGSIRWPVLALNMFLGAQGSHLYRDKLVLFSDWVLAAPRPNSRVRRFPIPIPAPTLAMEFAMEQPSSDSQQELTLIKNQYNFESWKNHNQLSQTLYISGFFLDIGEFPDWNIQIIEELEPSSHSFRYIHSIWRMPNSLNRAVRADFYECRSRLQAQEFTLELLRNAQIGVAATCRIGDIGDISFRSRGEDDILFTRANMVVFLQRSDRLQVPIIQLATKIDAYLTSEPRESLAEESPVPPQAKHKVPLSKFKISKSKRQKEGERSPRRFLKIYSNSKDLTEENGNLILGSKASANQKIRVYSIFEK